MNLLIGLNLIGIVTSNAGFNGEIKEVNKNEISITSETSESVTSESVYSEAAINFLKQQYESKKKL